MVTTQPWKKIFQDYFARADILVGGSRPWDIQVKDERFYARALAHGSLGFGESYVDGWWDCPALDQMFTRLLRAKLEQRLKPRRCKFWCWLRERLGNRQRASKAREVCEKHYDAGNLLYRRMLDRRMVYSCGYWQEARNLEEAQEAKLELICRKLELEAGMHLLDIGCGWLGFARFAAERYQVKTVGITLSREQLRFGQEHCHQPGIEIRYQDYRTLAEKFDRIVSIGMFEHVGSKNYRTFMGQAAANLEADGLFLLHTIGSDTTANSGTDPWLDKYIFPNGQLPSARQISQAAEEYLTLEDWHNFGQDYDPTLMAWHANFCRHWAEIERSGPYDERFRRQWSYYLLSCAAGSRARHYQLWQIVFSKNRPRPYRGYR